jgi:hypothetical protein
VALFVCALVGCLLVALILTAGTLSSIEYFIVLILYLLKNRILLQILDAHLQLLRGHNLLALGIVAVSDDPQI